MDSYTAVSNLMCLHKTLKRERRLTIMYMNYLKSNKKNFATQVQVLIRLNRVILAIENQMMKYAPEDITSILT